MKPVSVLFVCTGNTCRSPLAEGWFRHLCEEAGFATVVASAGIYAVDGAAASRQTVMVLRERGVALGEFRSQPLTRELITAADYVVAMTQEHLSAVRSFGVDASEKASTLLAFLGRNTDVADPVGGTTADYRHCLALMEPALAALLQRISKDEGR